MGKKGQEKGQKGAENYEQIMNKSPIPLTQVSF